MQNPIVIVGSGILAMGTIAMSNVIDSATHVPLGAALSVAAVVVPAGWVLSAKLNGIENRLNDQDKQLDNIERTLAKLQHKKYQE